MKTSWRAFIRRLAAVSFVTTATAWSAAMSYAQGASDNATNSAYANGWQEGDNGGFGFGPWNFDGSYNPPQNTIHLVNSTHPHNQLGTAWAMGLTYDYGLARAGRGFDAPLAVGQTLSVVVDIPTQHSGFKGYTIRLNTGGGNICFGGAGCTSGTAPKERFALWSFHDQGNPNEWGRWRVTPSPSPYFIPFYDEQSDAGLRIDFKLTGAESFDLKLTELSPAGAEYSQSGVLHDPGTGAIDWIEFLHYDHPSLPDEATDIYISSMMITGGATPTGDFDDDDDVDGADFLAWQRGLGMTSGAVLGDGDSDGDGDVDATDLSAWKSQFGSSATVAASGAAEPVSRSLVAAGIAGIWLLRRSWANYSTL